MCSMPLLLRLPHDLHQIWRLVLCQNLTRSNLIIVLLGIVVTLTTMFLLLPVASCIHLAKKALDTHAAACLWTTQARYLIFHNIQIMLAKQYNVPSTLNQWHGMKGSGSRHSIRIMKFCCCQLPVAFPATATKVFILWGRC